MRLLQYKLENGKVVNTLAEIGSNRYTEILTDIGEGKNPITPARKAILDSGKCVIPKSKVACE